MFETELTVIGYVATAPTRRRLKPSGAGLTEFRLISHSRRYDKKLGEWIEGNQLALNVTCWRELSGNVYESVKRGDPVIAKGRLSSYQSTDPVTGVKKTGYQLEAHALGHNLSLGTSDFRRPDRSDVALAGLDGPPPPEFDRIIATGYGLDQPEQPTAQEPEAVAVA